MRTVFVMGTTFSPLAHTKWKNSVGDQPFSVCPYHTGGGFEVMFAYDCGTAYSSWTKESWQPATEEKIIKAPIKAAPVDKLDRPEVLQWRHIDPTNTFSKFRM